MTEDHMYDIQIATALVTRFELPPQAPRRIAHIVRDYVATEAYLKLDDVAKKFMLSNFIRSVRDMEETNNASR